VLGFGGWINHATLVNILEVSKGGLVKEAMDRTLDVDELLVQRAGASRAADASSIGAVVRDLLILEELGYVEDDDFAGGLG
jgi:hypothetical protein